MKRLFFFGKILISFIILFVIFQKINYRGFIETVKNIPIQIIVSVFIVSLIKHLTQIKNWDMILRLDSDYKLPFKETVKNHFIGAALRLTVPGGHGIYARVFFLDHKKKSALGSTVLEKFFQIWICLFSGVSAGLFAFKNIHLALRISFAVIVGLLPFALLLLSKIKKFSRYKSYSERYSEKFPFIILNQFIFLSLTVCQYFLLLNSMKSINFLVVASKIPLILMAATVPVSFSGLGIRESVGIKLFATEGFKPELFVASAGIVFLFSTVIPAVTGVLFINQDMKKKKKKEK